MIVVDASVAVKWVTGEQDRDAANELLSSGGQLAGPFLLRVEVTAALARKVRFGEIPEIQATAAMTLWAATLAGGDVELFSEESDLARALALAIELDHPLQDCLYLALAERLNAPLVTADEKFAAKARRKHPSVRTLSTFKP